VTALRIKSACHILREPLTGTRREELLLPPDDLRRLWLLCKVLADRRPGEAMDLLLNRLRRTASNAEFMDSLSL